MSISNEIFMGNLLYPGGILARHLAKARGHTTKTSASIFSKILFLYGCISFINIKKKKKKKKAQLGFELTNS